MLGYYVAEAVSLSLYLTNCMGQRPYREASSNSASQKIRALFMEPEGSLPFSQEPATTPHLKSDVSYLQFPILFT